jgi:hypothetical protein
MKIDKRVAELSVEEYDPAEVVEAFAVITMEIQWRGQGPARPQKEGEEIRRRGYTGTCHRSRQGQGQGGKTCHDEEVARWPSVPPPTSTANGFP